MVGRFIRRTYINIKGLIKVSPESLMQLTSDCISYMSNFKLDDREKKSYKEWSLFRFKWVEHSYYDAPFWYGYKSSLVRHMHELHDMACHAIKVNDEIWLSELSYKNMVMLKNGNDDANPIFITNY